MIGVVKNDSGLASCRSVILLKTLCINLNAQHLIGMTHFDFTLKSINLNAQHVPKWNDSLLI